MSQTQTKDIEKKEQNLPALRPPRLPYHPIIKEEFGYDIHAWKALVEAIFPNAKTPESVRLALSYCKARKLDPFKRCIHIVPIWDSAKRQEVDTIWPGIGELRTTAHRTRNYAGRDKTEFGPMVEHTWNDVTIKFPEWAQVTVYRMVNGARVAYAGPQVYWMETYASHKEGVPNSMWRKRPRGQIDKCAEAAALRAAFPEEVGNDYIEAEAHSPEAMRQTFEEAQHITETKIEKEQGSVPIDTTFEPNGDEEQREPETQAKIDQQKKDLQEDIEKAEKKKKRCRPKKAKNQRAEYHCDACNRDFENFKAEDQVKGWQCPHCLSWRVHRNQEQPEFMEDEESA